MRRYNTIELIWRCFSQMSESLEEFVTKVNNEIAQLCAENILLWQQFLDTFCHKEAVQQYLAKQHHQLRVSVSVSSLGN